MMVKLNDVLRKADKTALILKIALEKIQPLEEENRKLRMENERLNVIQTELIRALGERIYKKKLASGKAGKVVVNGRQ